MKKRPPARPRPKPPIINFLREALNSGKRRPYQRYLNHLKKYLIHLNISCITLCPCGAKTHAIMVTATPISKPKKAKSPDMRLDHVFRPSKVVKMNRRIAP